MIGSFILWAQEAPAAPKEPPYIQFLPILVLGLLAYLMLFRPMMRQEKERKQLRSSLKKDDKILTTSGIYGTVVSVAEKEDEVLVKIADNVRIKLVKAAIDRNLTNEEAAREAKSPKPATS